MRIEKNKLDMVRKKENQMEVIVPAAGQGKRMQHNGNKLFLPLKGVPIIYRTLAGLSQIEEINRLIIVIRESERKIIESIVQRYGALKKECVFIEGGDERSDSVRKGLKYVVSNPKSEMVMTHDGARPFLLESMVNRLIEGSRRNAIAVPVQKVAETARKLDEKGKTRIVDRQNLYLTQTPQLFYVEDIKKCFFIEAQEYLKMTDEAGYFESANMAVLLVEGDKRNIKITTPEDLVWANMILNNDKELQLEGIDEALKACQQQ